LEDSVIWRDEKKGREERRGDERRRDETKIKW
jgi:hypothetical protein